MVGDLVNGFSHRDNNFNVIDVRDVAEAQVGAVLQLPYFREFSAVHRT